MYNTKTQANLGNYVDEEAEGGNQYQQSQYGSAFGLPPSRQYASAGAETSLAAVQAQYAQTMQQLASMQQQQGPGSAPSQPQYNEQSNYYAYQQQQQQQVQAYNQQQREQQQQSYAQEQARLLKQLYATYPDSNIAAGRPEHQTRQQSQGNDFYTAEQYFNNLNTQQNQVQNAQQQHTQQQYHHGYNTPTQVSYDTGNPMDSTRAPVGPRNGLANTDYSRSNRVSHVKYQSGNLSYNY